MEVCRPTAAPVVRCRCTSAGVRIIALLITNHAGNSAHRLCWPSAACLHAYCAVLAPVAFSPATPAVSCAASADSQFPSLRSGVRRRSPRDVAHPARRGHVGARSTCWFAQLACPSTLGCGHRDVSAHGLCLLVVALG